MACPTCAVIAELLSRTGVLSPAQATSFGYQEGIRFIDDKAVGGVKKKAIRKGGQKFAKSKYGRKLAKALKETNKKARKKSGGLRKGWDQRRIMTTAQKLARRM